MLNSYKKSSAVLFVGKVMLDMKKMKAELNEHRYGLERNVERRVKYLLKHIALLESCNATLCDKLALVHKELATLKQQPAHTLAKQDAELHDRTARLYIMNNQTQKPLELNVQDKDGELAAAA